MCVGCAPPMCRRKHATFERGTVRFVREAHYRFLTPSQQARGRPRGEGKLAAPQAVIGIGQHTQRRRCTSPHQTACSVAQRVRNAAYTTTSSLASHSHLFTLSIGPFAQPILPSRRLVWAYNALWASVWLESRSSCRIHASYERPPRAKRPLVEC